MRAAGPEPYDAFKHHIRSTIAFAMQCAARHRGRGARLFEPEPGEDNFEEMEIAGGISDELLGFVRKYDKKRQVASGKVQPAAGTRGGRPAS